MSRPIRVRPMVAALAVLAVTSVSACAPDRTPAPDEPVPAAGLSVTAGPAAPEPAPAAAPSPARTAATRPASAANAGPERSPRRIVLNGVDFTGIGYDKGSPTAPIVVVDFSDFGCPYCGLHSRETLPALVREFIATGKVFYKHVPIVMGFRNGDRSARAAECAADQAAFWPMHDRLYVGQQDWRKQDEPAPIHEAYAKELGLDVPRFAACLADGRTDDRTQAATTAARAIGVRATPTFVIDGQGVEGALPLDVFRQVLSDPARR